ncbi:MAG: hypothetical protein IT523_09385 [Burkholderiales bacterium]|nr:hypothetical protein [Burkholderiales bacterium]
MQRIVRKSILPILFLLSAPTFAQMKVFVAATTPDSVGSRLVYSIKEGIRRSAGMALTDRSQDSIIRVNIVTLDPDKNENSSRRTIYSVVWTAQTFHSTPVTMYLTNSVGLCGSNRVQECAEDLVADTDRQASTVRSWIQDILSKPNS